MKVKELIKELKKVDQEAIVGIPDWKGSCEEIYCVDVSLWDNLDGSPKDIILRS